MKNNPHHEGSWEDAAFARFMALVSEGHEAVINHEEVEEYHAKVRTFIRSEIEAAQNDLREELVYKIKGIRSLDEIISESCHKSQNDMTPSDYKILAYDEAISDILKIIKG